MVSVIIPVLNEVAIISDAIQAVFHQAGIYEVIVVDGGSSDGTPDAVEDSDAILMRYPVGLVPDIGGQINLGASCAKGDILLFLHCDVTLPPRAIELVSSALDNSSIVGGGFVPAFTGLAPTRSRIMLRMVERVWQFRTRRLFWFAGDTASFIRTDAFKQNGGYPTTGFASDWDFAAKLHSLGMLVAIKETVLVDSRRHVMNGVLKTLCVTGSLELMYHLGLNRMFMRKWYRMCLPHERKQNRRQGSAQ